MPWSNACSDLVFSLRLLAYTVVGIPTPKFTHLLRGRVPVIISTPTRLQRHLEYAKARMHAVEIRMDTVDARESKLHLRMTTWEKIGETMTNIQLGEFGTKYPFDTLGCFRHEQYAIESERAAIDSELQAIGQEIAAIEGDIVAIRALN